MKALKTILIYGLLFFQFISAQSENSTVAIFEKNNIVAIENKSILVNFNLSKGTYSATDKTINKQIINDAYFTMAMLKSTDSAFKNTWEEKIIEDELGIGKTLSIKSSMRDMPTLIFQITLYNEKEYVVLNGGVDNVTDFDIKLQNFHVLVGSIYKDFPVMDSYMVLDGNGGGEETKIRTDKSILCKNNALIRFGKSNNTRTFVCGGLTYHEFEKYVFLRNDGKSIYADVRYEDPIGRLIDAGSSYIPDDKIIIGFNKINPFEALEEYGLAIKKAQKINLNQYTFPTVCLWYASVEYYGGGPLINDTRGAVWETDNVVKSGFLNYSKVGIRLVPDNYEQDNQQGWWDDKHWQKYGEQIASTMGPHYKKPYETTKKWAGAVTNRGCIPFTYFQGARRSEDFCNKYPQYMLFNQSNRIAYDQSQNRQWWTKIMLWSYDYTDPGFIKHMQKVYKNLHDGGIKGMMFDYVDQTGWASEGGFENKYATTSYAYRMLFKLASDGLGKDSYIHERNLDRGSDITLGVSTSHRTWGDTDKANPFMISRCGLRWYKNRVVINYDMDSKNPNRVIPANSLDGYRSMFTMSYVVSGRLLLGCSFSKMNVDQLHTLSRVVPFHSNPQSARPIDAFSGKKFPQVYDFVVNEKWHQLTFYNTEVDTTITKNDDLANSNDKVKYVSATIEVEIGTDNMSGGLELNPKKEYFVYDFWNDNFIGKIKGDGILKQSLRPGEARMMSVHEAESNPQFISTNRHIMQGYIDLKDCKWDAQKKQLSGISEVVKNDTYTIIIATNGFTPVKCTTSIGKASIQLLDEKNGLYKISIDCTDNNSALWVVEF